jgi:hypothetical protein
VLPKGVTAVTRGKENPVLVSVVAPAAEEAEAAAAAASGRRQGCQARLHPRQGARPPRHPPPRSKPARSKRFAKADRNQRPAWRAVLFGKIIRAMIKLFVGLGNPGTEYQATRHNAGFWWIDALARELKVTPRPRQGLHGHVARTTMHGQTIWLLKPQTFMNLSGKSVRRWRASTRSSQRKSWWP